MSVEITMRGQEKPGDDSGWDNYWHVWILI